MKTFTWIMMVVASMFFIVVSGSVAWSESLLELGNGMLSINLECRNPGTPQDVAKTPIIRNTTGKWLAKGTKINWSASDGDQGTIILQTALSPHSFGEHPPGIDDEVQGIGKAGQIYTCTACAVHKLQLKEAELEIKNVEFTNEHLCLNETFKVRVHIANNGGGPTPFRIRTPHPTTQMIGYNINANQETEIEVFAKSSGVIKDGHVGATIYLANSLSGNPQCEKYGGGENNVTFCDSDMTNQTFTIKIPYGAGIVYPNTEPGLCPEEKPTLKAVPQDMKISLVSSKDTDNVLTIKLNNSSLKPLKRHAVEIQSPSNGKTIWRTSMSFSPGTNYLKIDHKDLDMKFQSKGKKAYHVLINNNRIGTIFIHNRVQFQKINGSSPFPVRKL